MDNLNKVGDCIEEVNELIEFYKIKVERKKRLIEEYVEESDINDGFKSSKREIEFKVLFTEINLINQFIEQLSYINRE